MCARTSGATSNVFLGVEAEELLQAADGVAAQLRAVRGVVVGLARRGPRDERAQADERRAVGDGLGRLDRGVQRVDVLAVPVRAAGPVDELHVPAVRLVARDDVLGERDLGVALDRDVVVVPQHDEVAQLLRARDGRRLAGHALLQVTVGGDDVDVVVERAGAGRGLGVEQAPLAPRRHREADGRGEALAERAGGDLHAGRVPVLGVARRLRAPGAQRLQVLELQAEAGQVQLDVLRQAGVARGQHEPVPAQPVRVRRVVPQHVLVEQVGRGGEADRRPGVAVADLLDRVGGQDTHRVHRPQVEVGPADRLGQGSLRVHRTSFPPGQGSGCRSDEIFDMIFDMTRHPRRMPGRWDVTPSRRSSDRANRPYSAPRVGMPGVTSTRRSDRSHTGTPGDPAPASRRACRCRP